MPHLECRQSSFLDQLRARSVRSSELLKLINLMNIKGCMQLIEIHNRWAQKLHIMRLFDEETRENQEGDKWIPETMPEGFDIDRGREEAMDVVEQDGSKAVSAVGGECTVSPFLQDFLTRKA